MTPGGKPVWRLCALSFAVLAAIAIGAPGPAAAAPPGVDEYQLNLPDGGGGNPAPEEAPEAPAPVEPAPVVPVEPAPVAPVAPVREPRPEPVLASDSVNGSLAGGHEIPPLVVRADDDGAPALALVLAALAAACCVLALWRLRIFRELPVARRQPVAGGAPSAP